MSNINHGTGRRKRAVARVFIKSGKGNTTVNGREVSEYFNGRQLWIEKALEPLQATKMAEKLDIKINVSGGGLKGQAEAVRLGIARALLMLSAANRAILKPLGMLVSDARKVERKHYYKRKARKATQYSKR